MDPWKIEAVKADPENIGTHDLLMSFITCVRAWKRLSKPARAAVEAAYPDDAVKCHPLTMNSLKAHGFVECGRHTDYRTVLTAAGREVAKRCVKP